MRRTSRERAQAACAGRLRAGRDERRSELDGWEKDSCDLLEQAWVDYERALRGLLVNDGRTLQRVATLHWLAVQVESLSAVLGKPSDDGRWEAAKLCADMYVDHHDIEERAWAHASLAELWLLRLAAADVAGDEERSSRNRRSRAPSRDGARTDVSVARSLPDHVDAASIHPIRQTGGANPRFERDLAAHGLERRVRWTIPCGLLEIAARVIEVLQPRSAGGGPQPPGIVGRPAKSSTHFGAGGTSCQRRSPGDVTVWRRPPLPREGARASRPRRRGAFFDIRMLPAGHGDCLWIEYGDSSATHRWLIDGGTQASAAGLLRRIESLPENERHFELLVLSHIDSDHIGGALPLIKAVQHGLRFGDVWFNGWRHVSGQPRGQAGRDVLVGDRGHEPAVECVATGSRYRRRGRRSAQPRSCRAE